MRVGAWFKARQVLVFFILETLYLVLLLTMAYFYVRRGWIRNSFPDPLEMLPVSWFGALGAVSISLRGVFDHGNDWDSKWNYWHIARPITGAIFGSMAYVFLLVIVSITGQSPSEASASSSAGILLYYSLAFVVGYREETFRNLLQKVTDVIVGPGET